MTMPESFVVDYDGKHKAWPARIWHFDLDFHSIMSKIRNLGCSELGYSAHELRLLVAFSDDEPAWLSMDQFRDEYNSRRRDSIAQAHGSYT